MEKTDNYKTATLQGQQLFLQLDQEAMLRRFPLKADGEYIYLRFLDRDCRIDRTSGVVTWTEDGFATETAADFNLSMTVYDLLSYSDESAFLTGEYSSINSIGSGLSSSGPGGEFFDKSAKGFQGRCEEMEKALLALGGTPGSRGDVSAILPLWGDICLQIRFFEEDEDFPASLQFLWDRNILQFMHFETTFYATGYVLKRVFAKMEEV